MQLSLWWSVLTKIVNDLLFSSKNSFITVRLGSKYAAVACKEQRKKLSYMKSLKHYGPLLWMGFNYLKVTERLRGSSLLVTTQSPGFPGTHLIIFGRMKG